MTTSTAAPGRRPLVALGDFFFRFRNIVFPIVMIALFAGFKPAGFGGDERVAWASDALGFLIALAGQVLRAAVIGLAYIKRGGKDGRVYANTLVTEGFFNHCRNPLYLGNILIALGLFVIHGDPRVCLIGMAFVLLMYVSIVAAEEAYLSEKFGEEYAAYCRRVNRWLPKLRGLRATMTGMRFQWRRLIAKEHGSTYVWLSTSVLLVGYEAALREPRPGRTFFAALAGVLAALTLGWVTAQFLKKTGRLREPGSS